MIEEERELLSQGVGQCRVRLFMKKIKDCRCVWEEVRDFDVCDVVDNGFQKMYGMGLVKMIWLLV